MSFEGNENNSGAGSLLNFEFIKDGIISGLSTSEVDVLAGETSEKTFMRNNIEYPNIEDGIAENFEMYPELDSTMNEMMNVIEEEMKAKHTVYETQNKVKKLKEFLKENNLPCNIETMPEMTLASYLRFFYSSLRKQDGSYYAPSTLIGIRASIHRYLTQAPVNRNIDILHGSVFKISNNMLKAMIGKHLKNGGKLPQSTPEIEKCDLIALGKYFDRLTPSKLQEEVFFKLQYHFGFRGRENLRDLKISTFVKESDGNGRSFYQINESMVSKNVKASLTATEWETIKTAKMFEEEEKNRCPVAAFELYKEKIDSDITFLFPQTTRNWKPGKKWFTRQPYGKNSLGNFMKNLSARANLSKQYKNHSIRATLINQLRDAGYRKEDIVKLTGHKNPESLKSYFRKRCPDSKMREMSETLSESMLPTSSKRVMMENNTSQIDHEAGPLTFSYEENCCLRYGTNIFNGPVTFYGNVTFNCNQRNQETDS